MWLPFVILPRYKENTSRIFSFKVDEILKTIPHSSNEPGRFKEIVVLRQPVKHCFFNPIELVWAYIKNYVAKRNSTCNLADVLRLTKEAIENVRLLNVLKLKLYVIRYSCNKVNLMLNVWPRSKNVIPRIYVSDFTKKNCYIHLQMPSDYVRHAEKIMEQYEQSGKYIIKHVNDCSVLLLWFQSNIMYFSST